MKKISFLISTFLTVLMLAGCESEIRSRVIGLAKGMNERCPIVLSQYHSITSVNLNKDTLEYKIITTEELLPMSSLTFTFSFLAIFSTIW